MQNFKHNLRLIIGFHWTSAVTKNGVLTAKAIVDPSNVLGCLQSSPVLLDLLPSHQEKGLVIRQCLLFPIFISHIQTIYFSVQTSSTAYSVPSASKKTEMDIASGSP